jgi:hypothetical protein
MTHVSKLQMMCLLDDVVRNNMILTLLGIYWFHMTEVFIFLHKFMVFNFKFWISFQPDWDPF